MSYSHCMTRTHSKSLECCDPTVLSLCCLHEAQNCSSQLDPQRKGKAILESTSGEECQVCEGGCELTV